MVLISIEARLQIDALARHYDDLAREQATLRMVEAVTEAVRRIDHGIGPFFKAPRPYPDMVYQRWQWAKVGRYWIAFEPIPDGYSVTAVFYDTANIPGRL